MCVFRMWVERKEQHTHVNMCAHLPVKDNTPDEAQRQLVIPIYNICPSYVYQINLKDVKNNETE